MAMTISIDDALKDDFSAVCKEIGLTPSAAINVFAKTVVREKAIPFELSSVSRSDKAVANVNREIAQAIRDSYGSYAEGPTFSLDDIDAMRSQRSFDRAAS